MVKFIVKLEITNSLNDDRTLNWKFFDTIEEKEEWIKAEKEEQYYLNYKESGARSHRYYQFSEYNDKESIMKLDMSEFEGMSFGNFIQIIKSLI